MLPLTPPPPQRCSLMSPQPLRGAGRQRQPSPPEGERGREATPATSRHFPSVWAEACGAAPRAGRIGPAAGRTRSPHEAARPKQRPGTAAPARSVTSPRPGRPSGAQPHTPSPAVTLRLSPKEGTGGGRGAGIPLPSPPAIPAPRH